jgi:hypothetical protein
MQAFEWRTIGRRCAKHVDGVGRTVNGDRQRRGLPGGLPGHARPIDSLGQIRPATVDLGGARCEVDKQRGHDGYIPGVGQRGERHARAPAARIEPPGAPGRDVYRPAGEVDCHGLDLQG